MAEVDADAVQGCDEAWTKTTDLDVLYRESDCSNDHRQYIESPGVRDIEGMTA